MRPIDVPYRINRGHRQLVGVRLRRRLDHGGVKPKMRTRSPLRLGGVHKHEKKPGQGPLEAGLQVVHLPLLLVPHHILNGQIGAGGESDPWCTARGMTVEASNRLQRALMKVTGLKAEAN